MESGYSRAKTKDMGKWWRVQGFFFTRIIQDHAHLQGYLRERYPHAFKGGRRKTKKVVSYVSEINEYVNNINYLNSVVCEGRQTDIKILEAMSVDEYYATINNFLKLSEQKAERNKTKWHERNSFWNYRQRE